MARKRKVPIINLVSSDCSDVLEDDELSLPLDSLDPDENDDSIMMILLIQMIHLLMVINLSMKLCTRST